MRTLAEPTYVDKLTCVKGGYPPRTEFCSLTGRFLAALPYYMHSTMKQYPLTGATGYGKQKVERASWNVAFAVSDVTLLTTWKKNKFLDQHQCGT
jgi:hypothetical protein